MGYTQGIKWNDKMIKEGILTVVNVLGIERMPSNKEVVTVTGDYSLANKIAKTKGYYGWAEQLGLPIKESETEFGRRCEKYIAAKLEEHGHKCELTSVKCPYDIVVDNNITVDVKCSRRTLANGSWMYSFNLERGEHVCDFFIAYCVEDDKHYIIPSKVVWGIKQLSIGIHTSIYDTYLERWDLLV